MKVLFFCPLPFSFAHGGAQIQIEQTQAALQKIGVSVEPLRWWDPTHSGDILHHFGRIQTTLLRLARAQGTKIVMSPFLSGAAARPAWVQVAQRLILRGSAPLTPAAVRVALDWDGFLEADACVAMTRVEADLMIRTFGAPAGRVTVIPNGVEQIFLKTEPRERGKWLVCTASIIEMKQVLKLAESAVAAGTPVWIIGKPYSESDPYAKIFAEYARSHSDCVRYEGPINDRVRLAQIYAEARGFVLLSKWEMLSLSALEAAACGCPLLLSDLPWARDAFGDKASYCLPGLPVSAWGRCLKKFYDEAPRLETPPKPASWEDVAQRLKTVYERLLQTVEEGD